MSSSEKSQRQIGIRWVLRQLMWKSSARVGGSIFLILVFFSIAAPFVVPYDIYKVDPVNRLLPPSTAHWLGTDELGRDLLSRILYGTRYMLLISFAPVVISGGCGVLLGLLSGTGGRWADMLIMRFVDLLLSFPFILLLLVIISILGPSLGNVILAVGIGGIPGFARIVRGEILSVKQEEYVEAMRALGASPSRIMFQTVLPNVVSPIIVYASLIIPIGVLIAAALSFLGLGAQPPIPEWGAMLVSSRSMLRQAWWVVVAPGLAIFICALGLNLFGNALRDVLDPRDT